jgi:hypothetical protein
MDTPRGQITTRGTGYPAADCVRDLTRQRRPGAGHLERWTAGLPLTPEHQEVEWSRPCFR